MNKKGWTPVRDGTKYCSPLCGGGCTSIAYERAVEQATNLAKQLSTRLGEKWKPVVWENLGWHWRAECGTASVYPTKNYRKVSNGRYRATVIGYTAFFNSAHQFVESATTPEVAVERARKHARKMANTLLKDAA